MWNNKQQQNDFPSSSPAQAPAAPAASFNSAPAARPTPPTAKNLSCLGASLEIKGQVSGDEDLQVDGKITGPVSLGGQKVTVGRTGQLNSEVSAREIVVYGKVMEICARATEWKLRKTARWWATSRRRASAWKTARISRAASKSSARNRMWALKPSTTKFLSARQPTKSFSANVTSKRACLGFRIEFHIQARCGAGRPFSFYFPLGIVRACRREAVRRSFDE